MVTPRTFQTGAIGAALSATVSKGETKSLPKDSGGLSNIQKLYAVGGVLDAFSIAVGSLGKASAIRAKGKFEEAGFIENSRRLELAAADAIKRGDIDSANFMKEVRKNAGTQKATLAAQGIEISSGSAAVQVQETLDLGLEDSSTIRTNALRESLGLKLQSIQQQTQAQLTRVGRKFDEKATKLAGISKAGRTIGAMAAKIDKAGSA